MGTTFYLATLLSPNVFRDAVIRQSAVRQLLVIPLGELFSTCQHAVALLHLLNHLRECSRWKLLLWPVVIQAFKEFPFIKLKTLLLLGDLPPSSSFLELSGLHTVNAASEDRGD